MIFFIYDGGDVAKIRRCISSLRKHSACHILLYSRKAFDLPVQRIPLSTRWDGRRMLHRMELAMELPVSVGDRVISCDVDVHFQGDPFTVFQSHDFDLFYTSREYVCDAPVNAGVWGFVNGVASRAALRFMVNQAQNPSWSPYLQMRRRLKRTDREVEIDWWVNQDLLCAVHEAGLGSIITFDAGSRYNYCPKTGPNLPLNQTVIADFQSKFGDPNYIILHYKELEGKI